MTVTYKEVEKGLLDGLYSDDNYGEVQNGNITVLIQLYEPGQWRVQFYHVDTKLIVQAEHIMDNDDYTLKLIHEALNLLEKAPVMQIVNMQKFTQNLITVRELEDGSHVAEYYPVTCVKEFLQISELFHNDDSVKAFLDGNGLYPSVKKQLEKYGIEA